MQLADPDRHHFIVECRLANPASRQAFTLPSWIPGSYLLREFARHVVAIDARDDEGPVALEQEAKGTWVAGESVGALVLRATIHAFDLSVRGAYFDRERAFLNGTALFFEPDGRAGEAIELTIDRPPHASDWQVATAMTPADIDPRGFGRYRAADYGELIDHPFEIGRLTVVKFEAADVPHRLVIAGRFDTDLDRVATDLAQLCTAQIDFFGRPAPFTSYAFLGLAVGDGYGGLEHRASSSLIFRRTDLPRPGDPGMPRGYQRFLGLCSHEYFHSWHIKRTKPAAFMPYALDRRNPTRLLWVFEGITSYYQERFLLLSGLLGAEAHLRRLAESLTRVYRVPGRYRQTLEQSSFNAWDRLYKPHLNSANQDVSYYGKGALVALALDLALRSAEPPRATLDHIVLELWRRFGSRDIGLPEDGFETLAIELGGDGIRDLLSVATRGTADPDLRTLFDRFGLRFELRQAEGPRDAGGTPASQETPRPALGAGFEAHGAGLRLTTVFDGQPAEAAGLAPGDIMVALDRIQATGDSIAEILARYDEGDEIEVSFFRGDVLSETRLTVAPAPRDTCFIAIDDDAPGDALARRRAWLGDG
ncbi:MAG TPA: PDZ domain-containing protein [Gammaproteobacteria bacterium]|nr:PDZ domain-containing protein [Gammaproteobacteria bacterium]